MPDVNRKDLMATGKELNTLLEPQPKIKVVGVKTADLEKSIAKAGALIEDGDKLTETTISVLTALGVELPEGMVQPADEDDAATDGDAVEEATDDINDDTDESPEAEANDGEAEAEAEGGATLQALYALAKDMNEVMGLAPAIGTKGKDKEDLKVEILNNCYDDDDNCEVYTTDELTDPSWATLKQLGVKPVDPNDKAEPKKGDAKAGDKKSDPVDKAAVKKEAAEKAKAEKAAKAKAKKDAAAKAKDKGPKKPGVIASIIEIIKDDGPVPKEDILKKMLELFPDRNEKSMKSTINTQVPGRINKERDFTIEDNGKGWQVK